MPWIGGAIAGLGSLAGGIFGANAQQNAASEAQQEEEQALAFQKQIYGNTVSNEKPYISSGTNALYSLDSLYGLPGAAGTPNTGNGAAQAFQAYTQLPQYQFGLSQGELGANRALAAEGLGGSGAAAKSLDQFATGYASQGFNGYISQLQSLAGMGQSAISTEAGAGQNAANGVGNYLGQIGGIGAAGIIGGANSLAGGIQGGLGALTNSNFLNQIGLGGSSYGSGGGSGDFSGAGTTDPGSWGA